MKGRVEAVGAGQLLRSKGFCAAAVDVAFTSQLQRAHETCQLALASMAGPDDPHTWCAAQRIRRDVRLNERHYGAVTGRRKSDPELLQMHGKDTVMHWRRSVHGKPPPMTSPHPYWQPPPAPLTESLHDCQQRVLDCFHTTIAPALFEEEEKKEGLTTTSTHPPDHRTVVVVAHSNTIRSLMAYLDAVPEDRVPHLHVPNSVPILYRFDGGTRRTVSTKLQASAGGSHARWLVSGENLRAVRQALQPGGLLTRALFDALDANGDRVLSASELRDGLRNLWNEEQQQQQKHSPKEQTDWVVISLIKKMVRELAPDESLSLAEFERRAAEAYMGLELPYFHHEEEEEQRGMGSTNYNSRINSTNRSTSRAA